MSGDVVLTDFCQLVQGVGGGDGLLDHLGAGSVPASTAPSTAPVSNGNIPL